MIRVLASIAAVIAAAAAPSEVTEFAVPTPDSLPAGITAGPDGAVWFAEFELLSSGSQPLRITGGLDGNVWFTERSGNRIGRVNLRRSPQPVASR